MSNSNSNSIFSSDEKTGEGDTSDRDQISLGEKPQPNKKKIWHENKDSAIDQAMKFQENMDTDAEQDMHSEYQL